MEILDKVEIREEEALVVRIDLEGADSVGQPEAETVEIGPVEVAVEDESNEMPASEKNQNSEPAKNEEFSDDDIPF